jgi:succinate dehydrogenase / fumarate reductase cytochrome b subunit
VSPAPRVYKGRAGQWAFVLHRVSGFLVFFFLLLHIVDVSLITRPHLYNEVHALYGNVLLRLFECGLLFGLLYHSLNGLRIVVIDFFDEGVRYQRALFQAVVAITLVAGIPGSYVILKPWIEGHF